MKTDETTTWTGRVIRPLNLQIEDIDLEDIAVSLSNLCQFTGHCKFVSFAQHAVLVARRVAPERKLEAHLQWAFKAYVGDIPLSFELSSEMDPYKIAARNADLVIRQRFDLPMETSPEVMDVDHRVYLTEKREMMNCASQVGLEDAYPGTIEPWFPRQAYDNFIASILPYVDPEELPKYTQRAGPEKKGKHR